MNYYSPIVEKNVEAMRLLEEASECFEDYAPNDTWFERYFSLTGEHMILTEDGWETGEAKELYLSSPEYGPDYILKEVNAP
jgi:hypothetical protein